MDQTTNIVKSDRTRAPCQRRLGVRIYIEEGDMPCKQCGSSRQQDFQGELTVAFTGKEKINLSPVYVCQKTLVCLDCGYTAIVVPLPQLEQIRKGAEVLDSEGETTH